MVYEGKYLTYNEYKALGGNLDQTPFDLLEFKARNQIDRRTLNRIKNEYETGDYIIPVEVKLCIMNLINLFYSINNGVEISENAINYKSNEVNEEIRMIIENDLSSVLINEEPVLFRGV